MVAETKKVEINDKHIEIPVLDKYFPVVLNHFTHLEILILGIAKLFELVFNILQLLKI